MSAAVNSNFDNGLQMNHFNQERFISLSFILEGAIQRTYHDLDLMINMYIIHLFDDFRVIFM